MGTTTLYAVVLSVVNLFGCFSLPRWVVDVILDEDAAVIVVLYDVDPPVPLTGLPGIQKGPAAKPSVKIGEAHVYFGARLTVEYDKKGRAVSVSPLRP